VKEDCCFVSTDFQHDMEVTKLEFFWIIYGY